MGKPDKIQRRTVDRSFLSSKKGFTVLLHHPTDLFGISSSDHRNAGQPAKNNEAATQSKVTKANDKVSETNVLRSHSYNVEFLGANENVQIVADKELSFYTNYFIGNDRSKWVSHARAFQAVVYQNIYPNIDVRYYSENGRLKYDLIVRPGGDVSRIALQYTGADKLSIRNRELIVKTSVGEVKELYPYSFQFDNVKGRRS